ncbi:hypothetical protein JZX76_11480 [Haloarcula hispanica]|uniref:Uncharacterized protein n=1 Tax=Haloarcula hispanica TaxID=51589 RepID=A0A482T2A7_HALHI|nr:hypothetical protein [Haloarcula hispanica]MCJ0620108.1 hypothetical protein [Haloarcula hispanica]RYJ10538.1 hypothetical protein ELS20_11405 [Haloarcula hispanica]
MSTRRSRRSTYRGVSTLDYYREMSRYMDVRKLKVIKAGINSLLVGVLALAAIRAGADPGKVAMLAIAVIAALGGVEWYELPAVQLVTRDRGNEQKDQK